MKKLAFLVICLFGINSQAQAQSFLDILFKKPEKKQAPLAKLYKDGESNVLQMQQERTVEVIGVVTDAIIKDVAQNLETLSRRDRTKPIYIFINSPGGSVGAGTVVLDAMAVAKRRGVRLICASGVMAASMGYIILAACDERYTLRNTKLLFHPMSLSVRGARVSELNTLLKTFSKEERSLSKATREAMGMGKKEYYKNYIAETMWPAYLLHERVPKFFNIVDDITGTENLFVYQKQGMSIFGEINLPALKKINQ